MFDSLLRCIYVLVGLRELTYNDAKRCQRMPKDRDIRKIDSSNTRTVLRRRNRVSHTIMTPAESADYNDGGTDDGDYVGTVDHIIIIIA